MQLEPHKKVVVSTLFFYKTDICVRWLRNFSDVAASYLKQRDDISFTVLCTNNAPDENISAIEDFVRAAGKLKNFELRLATSPHNLGFGGGHNANLLSEAAVDASYFIIINNDVFFPHLDFLDEAIHALDANKKLGAVGAIDVPGEMDSLFGVVKPQAARPPIVDYTEASVLVLRPEAFRSVGGFRPELAYAYYEDGDLSLRLRQNGWELGFVEIPHQHFRGSSTAALPPPYYHYLHEANRAYFLSRWSGYLRHRTITSRAYVDLSADGVGDVVYSFAPFCSFLREARRGNIEVTVGLKGKKMNFLFSIFEDVKTLDVNDYDSPLAVEAEGFDTLLYPARVVHSAPFHDQQLIAAALNLRAFDRVSSELHTHYRSDAAMRRRDSLLGFSSIDTPYAVVHLDSQRQNFEGRAVPFSLFRRALERLAADYPIVLIGQKGLGAPDPESDLLDRFVDDHQVVDIRNSTVDEIFLAIAGASRFVGIDSGPMHIAQQFEVPSFIVFGATHALTKIINRSLCYVVTNPDLDCLGCYHQLFEPTYSYCLRRDQACVRGLESEYLAEHMGKFLAGFPCDWESQEKRLAALQTQWLAQQMHHPGMKNPLLCFDGPQDLSLLHDVSLFLIDKIDQVSKEKFATSERRYREFINKLREREQSLAGRAARLEEELKRVQTRPRPGFVDSMAKSLFGYAQQGDAPPERKSIVDLGTDAKLEKMVVNVELERSEDSVVFNCKVDPMLFLPRLDVSVGKSLQLELELDSAMDVPVQVFWAKKQGGFSEQDSVRRTLHRDIGKIDLFLTPDSSPIYLRVDPGDGGERYIFKSLRVLV